VEIAFAEKSLRMLCENEARAARLLGTKVAGKLRARLADIRSAKKISDVPVGLPREIDSVDGDLMQLNLGKSVFLKFCANHPSNPLLKTGKVDWSKVRRIKIMHIGGVYEN
jgi:proteic killer suppression protein